MVQLQNLIVYLQVTRGLYVISRRPTPKEKSYYLDSGISIHNRLVRFFGFFLILIQRCRRCSKCSW